MSNPLDELAQAIQERAADVQALASAADRCFDDFAASMRFDDNQRRLGDHLCAFLRLLKGCGDDLAGFGEAVELYDAEKKSGD